MEASQTELLLVRHGQTAWNAAGRWQGHADPALSALGREQARTLASTLRAERDEGEAPWTGLLASDLLRARQTAEILGEILGLGLGLEIETRLRELDVGQWAGLSRHEIEQRDPSALLAFESGDPSVRPGGGESRAEIRRRARDLVHDLRKRFSGERLIVVTHLGVIRALLPGSQPGHADRFPVVVEELIGQDPIRATAGRPLGRGAGADGGRPDRRGPGAAQ